MKTLKLIALFVAVSLPCFAAGTLGHQAFGPVKFGMSEEQRGRAVTQLMEKQLKSGQRDTTAALLRKCFVTDGTKNQSKLAAKDAGVKVQLGFPTTEIPVAMASSTKHSSASYDTTAKEAWDVLKDVAEAKFGKAKTETPFPVLASLTGENKGPIVTGTWEVEGVKVELLVDAPRAGTDPNFRADVVLKATPITK